LSGWEGPTRFIDNGCIKLDNNIVERSTLNWKNALLRDQMAVPSAGPPARPWSKPASSTTSIRSATSLTSLPGSPTEIPTAPSISSSSGYQRQHLKAVA